MEDIDDYMSDAFLVCEEPPKKTGVKRKKEHLNTLSKKNINALMVEKMENSLSRPIEETNKGYKLLQKFGYKESEKPVTDRVVESSVFASSVPSCSSGGLSRSVASTAPLSVTIRERSDKSGVGKVSVKPEGISGRLQASVDKAMREKDQMEVQQKFQSSLSQKQKLREVNSLLQRAVKVANELDTQANPTQLRDAEDDGSDEATEDSLMLGSLDSLQVQLDEICDQLRGTHCYCIYCGCAYASSDELLVSCPGTSLDDH